MKKLLVHVCCVHCAAYTVEHWRREGYEVSGFWYNPNIHPYSEHQSRLESMKLFADNTNLPLLVDDSYDLIKYLLFVAIAGITGLTAHILASSTKYLMPYAIIIAVTASSSAGLFGIFIYKKYNPIYNIYTKTDFKYIFLQKEYYYEYIEY